jgi:hypothetical protein
MVIHVVEDPSTDGATDGAARRDRVLRDAARTRPSA